MTGYIINECNVSELPHNAPLLRLVSTHPASFEFLLFGFSEHIQVRIEHRFHFSILRAPFLYVSFYSFLSKGLLLWVFFVDWHIALVFLRVSCSSDGLLSSRHNLVDLCWSCASPQVFFVDHKTYFISFTPIVSPMGFFMLQLFSPSPAELKSEAGTQHYIAKRQDSIHITNKNKQIEPVESARAFKWWHLNA